MEVSSRGFINRMRLDRYMVVFDNNLFVQTENDVLLLDDLAWESLSLVVLISRQPISIITV